MGRVLILAGIFITVLGLVLVFASRIPFIGRLPGDIVIQKGNFRFYFPIVSGLIISLILTFIANIAIRLLSK